MVNSRILTKQNEVKVKAYFLSDIHLESEQDSNFFALKQLLTQILNDKECTHLFLLGDIFDLWVANHSYFTAKFENTLKLLKDIQVRGVKVIYFEGNHDLDLEPYFLSEGIEVHLEALSLNLGGSRFRIEHGDQMDPEDRGYLFLRWFLRTRFMRWLGRSLPGRIVQMIGNSMSSTSRKYTDRLKNNLGKDMSARREKIFNKIRRHVERVCAEGASMDFFISGHVHEELQEKYLCHGKEIEVINLGSWLGEQKPYGLFEESQGFEIKYL